jgi:hypothetical protein
MRLGAAASIIGHLAVLTLGLLFADAHPFDSMPTEAISVDIVAPEEAKALSKPADLTKPVELPQPDPIDFSQLLPQQPGSQAPQPKSQTAAAPAAPPPPPPAAPQATASPQSAKPQDAKPQDAKPQGAEALQSMLSPQAPSQPASQPPSPLAPEPDITVKYGVMLGLPSGKENSEYNGIDAPAFDTAKIQTEDIAAFRRHLKTCSSLPASVAPTDKVRIVLRVLLSRDGTLAAEPALLEASASVKGPVLMQKAMAALQACQPYTMLPADKYKEWKVLDLSFTPQDFTGG